MTNTESLISSAIELTNSADLKNSEDTNGVDHSDQPVEANSSETNLMSSTDTSASNSTVDWEKRYKDLQSFHSKRENELRSQIAELESADSSFQAPTTPEQMDAFKEEHPEVYNMMLTLAHQKATEATQGISTKLQTYEEEKRMSAINAAKAKLQQSHPDYIDVVQTGEFQEWAQKQPAQVQQWIYNNPDDPDLAIIALDRYKAYRDANAAHLEKEKEAKAAQEAAAQAVGSSSNPAVKEGEKIWTASEIKKMSSDDFRKHEKEIDIAYLQGRVNFKA